MTRYWELHPETCRFCGMDFKPEETRIPVTFKGERSRGNIHAKCLKRNSNLYDPEDLRGEVILASIRLTS